MPNVPDLFRDPVLVFSGAERRGLQQGWVNERATLKKKKPLLLALNLFMEGNIPFGGKEVKDSAAKVAFSLTKFFLGYVFTLCKCGASSKTKG